MLDIKFIRENIKIVKKSLKDRKAAAEVDVLLKLDAEKRSLLAKVESLKNKRNVASKEIGDLLP